MKLDCGETWEEKKERLSQWHSFFAIIPRKVGEHDCRWLEVIERREVIRPPYWSIAANCVVSNRMAWEYRAKEKK